MSSESWNADADLLAVRRERLLDLAGRAGEAGAEARRGRDQRAGLVGDHARGSARAGPRRRPGPTVSQDLALDEPGEGLRLDAYGVRARGRRSAPRHLANRKSPVRIATWLSQRAFADVGAAAQVGLVHHVVVVERGEVGQLDHAGRGDHARRASGSPNSAASSTSSGRNRLPPASQQVPGGLGDESGLARRRGPRSASSTSAIRRGQPLGEGLVEDRQGEAGARRWSRSPDELSGMGRPGRAPARARRRGPASRRHPSRWSTAVSTLGTATVGPSPTGSEKNISTMTRT